MIKASFYDIDSFNVSSLGLYSAYRLDNPDTPELSEADQARWVTAQYEMHGEASVLEWAEICARAIRRETSVKIETLSDLEQDFIASALLIFLESLEELPPEDGRLKKIADLRAVAGDFIS